MVRRKLGLYKNISSTKNTLLEYKQQRNNYLPCLTVAMDMVLMSVSFISLKTNMHKNNLANLKMFIRITFDV